MNERLLRFGRKKKIDFLRLFNASLKHAKLCSSDFHNYPVSLINCFSQDYFVFGEFKIIAFNRT